MDEKVLEEIRFHQDAGGRDANSPLFQIREKEMEISGRIFAARNQADKMVTDARQRSLEIVRNAQADADRLAKERADILFAQTQKSSEDVKQSGVAETAALETSLSARKGETADFVVKLVTSI